MIWALLRLALNDSLHQFSTRRIASSIWASLRRCLHFSHTSRNPVKHCSSQPRKHNPYRSWPVSASRTQSTSVCKKLEVRLRLPRISHSTTAYARSTESSTFSGLSSRPTFTPRFSFSFRAGNRSVSCSKRFARCSPGCHYSIYTENKNRLRG